MGEIMSKEIEEYWEQKTQAHEDYWKDIDENGREGKLGAVEEGSCWFILNGKDMSFDEVFGPPSEGEIKAIAKLDL